MQKEIPIDLKQLRYFVHIAEFGSFTQAADFLDIAQSVLSRQIRKLEVDLGQNLLVRNGRGVSLTESGTILLEKARFILHELSQTYEDVTSEYYAGNISMGLPSTLARFFAVPVIKDFHELLPNANLIITETLSASIEDQIISGKLDMGIVHNPENTSELELSLLAKENLFLLTPKNVQPDYSAKGVTLKEAAQCPLILQSYPNRYRLLIDRQMARISTKPNVILELNSTYTILELVAEGMGCAILSSKMLALIPEATRKGIIAHCIHSPNVESRIYLATSKKRIITKTQKTMFNIIRNLSEEHFHLPEVH